MGEIVTLSKQQARQFTLNQQGLSVPFLSILDSIERLSYIQIDTISITERAHHHVLFSRNPKYRQEAINTLVADKKVFEYWSHAAAYLPICDYRYSLYRKQQYKSGDKHWFERNKKVERYVMERIVNEGPLQSKDFENPHHKGHDWYSWKPAKIALTNLFMDGSLMISARQGFQKVFNLTENVIKDITIDTSLPTVNEYSRYLIERALIAHGFMNINEIVYLRKGIKSTVNSELKALLNSGNIVEIKVEGVDTVYFANQQKLMESLETTVKPHQVHLLSPFDNLVIQRKRLNDLFGFDYIIECYVTENKRQYGYYCIPVLYGDKLVARFDAKADRKSGEFKIKKIWYESGFKTSEQFNRQFDKKLNVFARFCGCQKVIGLNESFQCACD